MLAEDEDALVCDLMEYYGVSDWKSHDLVFIATLANGLPGGSRIQSKLAGYPTDQGTLLTLSIIDRLNLLLWQRTKDGANNRNKPESLVSELYRSMRQPVNRSYRTGEEFERARDAIIKKVT